MVLADYLKRQSASVIASFIDDGWAVCAATDIGALTELAGKRQRAIQPLGGYAMPDAVVVTSGQHAELWVRARLSGYGDVFRAFTAQAYSFTTPAGIGSHYNFDHLFSKGRVQTPSGLEDDRLPVTTLVRMVLVARPVNQSFGGLMESSMVGSGRADRSYRRFTYLQLAKALSVDANTLGGGFSGPNADANLAIVARKLIALGVGTAFGMTEPQLLRELQDEARKILFFREHRRST